MAVFSLMSATTLVSSELGFSAITIGKIQLLALFDCHCFPYRLFFVRYSPKVGIVISVVVALQVYDFCLCVVLVGSLLTFPLLLRFVVIRQLILAVKCLVTMLVSALNRVTSIYLTNLLGMFDF